MEKNSKIKYCHIFAHVAPVWQMKWSVCLISCQTARLPIISWPSFSSMGGIRYTQDLKSISSRIWMYFSRLWFRMVILNWTFIDLIRIISSNTMQTFNDRIPFWECQSLLLHIGNDLIKWRDFCPIYYIHTQRETLVQIIILPCGKGV